MTVELRVVSGARTGTRARFDTSVITIGRHALSDLRFDPQVDLDVSTRHAELRGVDGVWTLHDLESTNGTFVNGERVPGERRIHAGDTIGFGASGPRVEVHVPRDTTARVAEALRAESASLRRGFVVVLVLLVALGGAGIVWWQRQVAAREGALLAAIARSDRMSSGRNERTAIARSDAASLAGIDVAEMHDRNDAAVALIASDLDGTFVAATAFGVSARGLLVTNRHVVRAESGAPARRVRVLYANTRDWLPAHVVRMSDDDDLALLQLDTDGGGGSYPIVVGVSLTGSLARVGAAIATIGYPHAVDTPMESSGGLHITARTTTTAGTVSKRLDHVLQIDSYAGKGSSGSPVFDARGEVAGVIYGGATESNGRIVYAVPSQRLAGFLGADGAGIVR